METRKDIYFRQGFLTVTTRISSVSLKTYGNISRDKFPQESIGKHSTYW